MIWSWIKKRRRKKTTSPPFPALWKEHIANNVSFWETLSPEECEDLEDVVQVLVAEKHWEGCGGLEMTEEIKVTVAAQAGLLLLGLEHDFFRNVLSVLVYPEGYILPRNHSSDGVVVEQEDVPVLGTAHQQGPVILSWHSARHGGRNAGDGRNLVYHEFAHKLDMLDGVVDGTPPLSGGREIDEWVEVMTAAYDRLGKQARKGHKTLLDKYGATDVGEFFAVATEVFFEKPTQLSSRHPKLYGVLSGFYGQDPAARLAAFRQRR